MNPNSSTTPLYLLADDLAGAHDAAISFAKRGFAVAVLSDPDRLDRFDSADIVVLDTNTRSCVEAEAIERVGAACKAIQARSGTIIYKKIDSTLRGHVGLELDLVCSMMDFNLAVCAPAFPELGRTTVGGYQLLHGVPVRRADMAGPDIPPQHAFIADLLGNASKRETVRIDLKTVLGGSAAIQRAIAGIKADQGSTVVVDMADPGCWTGMLDAVLGDSTESTEARDKVTQMGSTLLCGSAGMAGALAERLAETQNPHTSASHWRPGASVPTRVQKEGPVLVFACSLHDTTVRQVEEISGRKATAICSFDPLLIVKNRNSRDEVERVIELATEALADGRNAVLTPKRPGHSNHQEWFKLLAEEADGHDPASMVIENLGAIAHRLFAGVDLGGLVLTGGETAGRVFSELDSDGAWILGGIDTGVALSAVTGGPYDGMQVVIKPGSYGNESTLMKAMDRLSSNTGDEFGGKRRRSRRKRSGDDERPVIGITLGDPNGVGPEIIAKILSQEWVYDLCRPLVVGNDRVLRRALPLAEGDPTVHHDGKSAGCRLDIHLTDRPDTGLYRHGTMDVLNAMNVEIDGLIPGQVQPEAGRLAVESVQLAARLAMTGEIGAMVTAPLNKEAMGLAGYTYPGHTELLAEVSGTKKYRLSLAFDGILVSHATTHVSLRDAIDSLSEEEIIVTVDLVGRALVGMGVAAPRIAVCGLNPHAGEGGLFGDEEIRIIAPALEKARARGWQIMGPLPPDTVFMRARKGDFDGIIGMYHDQGHIPVKAIAFDRTVNVTLGLPIIRTSVDHGTAFDIAGKGIADAGNLGEALRLAVQLVGDRWSVGSTSGEKATR